MKLSKHFTFAELITTNTGLPNHPSSHIIINSLRLVCEKILEPIRSHFGRPIIIHSGYRCKAVNAAVKGSPTSQHCRGEAVDFHVSGHTVLEVAQWIFTSDIVYDQLILENFIPHHPTSGWVHCSFAMKNRKKELTKFKGSSIYHQGILVTPPAR